MKIISVEKPFLTLKSMAWDEGRKGFFSPTHSDFLWKKGLITSSCTTCRNLNLPAGKINWDHTCGIYSSPNWEALEEYHGYPNSVVTMMNTYGDSSLWSAPDDVKHGTAWVLRSWSTRVVAIIPPPKKLTQRDLLIIAHATNFFEVDTMRYSEAMEMIQADWIMTIKYDPFDTFHPFEEVK